MPNIDESKVKCFLYQENGNKAKTVAHSLFTFTFKLNHLHVEWHLEYQNFDEDDGYSSSAVNCQFWPSNLLIKGKQISILKFCAENEYWAKLEHMGICKNW